MFGGFGVKRVKKGGVIAVKMEYIVGCYEWFIVDYVFWICLFFLLC